MIGADTETHLIRPGLKAPPLVCVSWADEPDLSEEAYAVKRSYKDLSLCETDSGVVHHSESFDLCEEILEGESVWGNAPFDLAVIGNKHPQLIDLIFGALSGDRIYDILTRQKIIDIAIGKHYKAFYTDSNGKTRVYGYSVADLAKRHLGIDLAKGDDTYRLRFGELHDVPVEKWPKKARDYARRDAEVLIPIWDIQEEEFGHILQDQFRQVRADMALHLSSCWGVRTSRDAVEDLDDETFEEWEEVRLRLQEIGLIRSTGSRDTKKAKKRLIEKLGVENCRLTVTGQRKVYNKILTHEDAILKGGYVSLKEEICESTRDPVLIDYARFGALIKLRNTYIRALWGGVRWPLQTRYEVLVDTGRVSSSKPNLMNPPREVGVRECFVPRPGKVFVGGDYDKAELCSLAETCIEVCGYSRLAERLNEGFDPHLDMGAQILGISYKEALLRQKEDDPEMADMRQMAKAANFGLPGGLGPDTFMEYARASYGVHLTRDEAVKLKSKWLQMWPEMREYFDWVSGLIDNRGKAWIVHPISRRCQGGISYTSTCNTFFQGRTADGAKAATYEVTRRQFTEPKSALYGSHIAIFMHDEIIAECDEEICHEVGQELSEVMVQEFIKFHPKLAKAVRVKPVAMHYWSKKAKPVYKKGRLVPWGEPKMVEAA